MAIPRLGVVAEISDLLRSSGVTKPSVSSSFKVGIRPETQRCIQEENMTKAQRWILLLGIVFLNVSLCLDRAFTSGSAIGAVHGEI